MSSAENSESKIQTYGWAELTALWQQIQHGETLGWANGKALEYFILRAFQLEGAEVRYPYDVKIDSLESSDSKSSLEQIDGIIYSDGIACLIECKNTADKVNFEPISKLRSQLMRRPSATIASIFSVKGFTPPALILLGFIHPQTVLAWEGEDIDICLNKKRFRDSLKQKYRKAIEDANYNFSVEDDNELLQYNFSVEDGKE